MEDIVKNLEKRVKILEQKRVYTADIMPKAVKREHLEDVVIVFGLAADLPTDDSTGIKAYFSTDTNVLSLYNGTAWVSETLT